MSATNTATDAGQIAKIEFACTDFHTAASVHKFMTAEGHDPADYRVIGDTNGFVVCDAETDPETLAPDPHPQAIARGVVLHRGILEGIAAITINAPSPSIIAPSGAYGQPALATKSAIPVIRPTPEGDAVSSHGSFLPSIGATVAKSDADRKAALPADVQALANEFSLDAECAEAVNKVAGGNAMPDDFSPYVLAILGARNMVDIRRNGQMGTPTVELSASIRNRVPASPTATRTDLAALTKTSKADAGAMHRSLLSGLVGSRS